MNNKPFDGTHKRGRRRKICERYYNSGLPIDCDDNPQLFDEWVAIGGCRGDTSPALPLLLEWEAPEIIKVRRGHIRNEICRRPTPLSEEDIPF
jgi:hypothetical protein